MKRVMIVDDDQIFLDEMTEILDMCGYEVLPLQDGFDVISEARKKHPEIILLDLKMKGINGFEVARMLKSEANTSDICLIAITGYFTESDHLPNIMKYGFDKCLIKPLQPLEVIHAVESI